MNVKLARSVDSFNEDFCIKRLVLRSSRQPNLKDMIKVCEIFLLIMFFSILHCLLNCLKVSSGMSKLVSVYVDQTIKNGLLQAIRACEDRQGY